MTTGIIFNGEMVREIRRDALSMRQGILDGCSPTRMCRAVCLPLEGWLAARGIECQIVTGEFHAGDFDGFDHSWIELADGTVVDPTIDQFNHGRFRFPKVYVGPPLEHHKRIN